MNIFFSISFSIAIGSVFLGLFILKKNQNKTQNIIFFLICLSLSCLNLISIPAYSSKTKDDVIFWSRLGFCCVNIFYALNLNFYVDLYIKKKTELWPVLYIPALFVISVFAIDPYLILDYVLYNGEWKLIPSYSSIWFYIASGYVIIYSLLSITLMTATERKAVSNKEKLQSRWIMINFIVSTGLVFFGIWVIPYFYPDIPNIGPTYHFFYVLGLFYAVFHFKFMEFNPTIAADEILSNINEMIFLLDTELKILSANKKCHENIFLTDGVLAGRNYAELVIEDDKFIHYIKNLTTGSGKKINCHVTYTSKPEPIITDTYFSCISDRFSDIIGILVISSENRNRRRFQTKYRITARELEIIDLMISGLSSREIGSKLGISDRTVESHQEHIYQKVSVSGKVELIRLAHEFSLTIN